MARRKIDFSAVKNQIEKLNQENKYQDPRQWFLRIPKGELSAKAIVRFMPNKKAEPNDLFFVELIEHNFCFGNTGQKRCYIETSPQTIGKECPVTELFFELRNSGYTDIKKITQPLVRRLAFISNVYVVRDFQNEENDGKVFYLKYGNQIMDILKDAIKGDEDLKIEPINPFDPFEGANIILKAEKKDEKSLPSYVNSKIDRPSQLLDDEDKIWEIIDNECLDIREFVNEDKIKSYDELLEKLRFVLAGTEIEKVALEIGSSLITEPYKDKNKKSKVVDGMKKEENEEETPKPIKRERPKKEVEEKPEEDDLDDLDIDDLDIDLDDDI